MGNGKHAELYLKTDILLSEGPHWDADSGTLYYVGIVSFDPGSAKLTGGVFSYDGKQRRRIELDGFVGGIVPHRNGGFVVLFNQGYYSVDFPGSHLQLICEPARNRPMNVFNDGKCDASGRFFAGTQSLQPGVEMCSLWRLDVDGTAEMVQDDILQSNGLGWSVDNRRMYHVDTLRGVVYRYDYDIDEGRLANRRVCVEIPSEHGYPDGMCVDCEDTIWVALYGGGAVVRYDPSTGKELDRIATGVPKTTSCAFGGRDLDVLFITTSAFPHGSYPSSINDGNILIARPGVKGMPANRCGGRMGVQRKTE